MLTTERPPGAVDREFVYIGLGRLLGGSVGRRRAVGGPGARNGDCQFETKMLKTGSYRRR